MGLDAEVKAFLDTHVEAAMVDPPPPMSEQTPEFVRGNFEILGRQEIVWDSATSEGDRDFDESDPPAGDGTYLAHQPLVQHNGLLDQGFRIVNPTYGAIVPKPPEYVENAPKDVVTALPGQITRIKAIFDKPGRYVWHCHILSHEDHEMMRVLHVGPGA